MRWCGGGILPPLLTWRYAVWSILIAMSSADSAVFTSRCRQSSALRTCRRYRDTRSLYSTADCPDSRRTSQRSRAADDVYMFHRPVSSYPFKSSAFLPEAPVQVGLLLRHEPMMVMAVAYKVFAIRPRLLQSAIPLVRVNDGHFVHHAVNARSILHPLTSLRLRVILLMPSSFAQSDRH